MFRRSNLLSRMYAHGHSLARKLSPDRKSATKVIPLVGRHGKLEHDKEGHHARGSRVAGLVLLGRLLRVDRREDLIELLEQVRRRFLVESDLSLLLVLLLCACQGVAVVGEIDRREQQAVGAMIRADFCENRVRLVGLYVPSAGG